MRRENPNAISVPDVAGNGLLDRRALIGRGMFFAGAAVAGVGSASSAGAEALPVDPWSMEPGATIPPYGVPAKYESKVVRTLTNPNNEPRTSNGRTPHHLLEGTITPNGLHFIVAAIRLPDIDPAQAPPGDPRSRQAAAGVHLEALARYPKVTRTQFVECGGNSAPLFNKEPVQANVQAIHGLVSCSQWTGVRLSTLLEETGIDPKAKWLIAEGADGPSMNRSIPLAKALDDVMVALYQNGERISRQGLPDAAARARLRRQHERQVAAPDQAHRRAGDGDQRDDAIHLPGWRRQTWQFFFPMEVKSFVTNPSPGLTLKGPGFYEISGLAYSGNGRIAKVLVSADGGKSWGEAALDGPVLSKALTRFRMPWRWDGQPVVLQSRAWDEAGNVQPTRAELFKERGEPKVNLPVTAFPMGQ